MSHTHQWKVHRYVLLALPRDGWSERCTQWHCATCPAFVTITAEVQHGYPLRDPPFWDQVQRSPAYQRTPEARMAGQHDRWRIR